MIKIGRVIGTQKDVSRLSIVSFHLRKSLLLYFKFSFIFYDLVPWAQGSQKPSSHGANKWGNG